MPLKILMTGPPRIGKSTIMQAVRLRYPGSVCGIVVRERRDAAGEREGFDAIDSDGHAALIAHRSFVDSPYRVGRYGVDKDAIDTFAAPAIEPEWVAGEALLLIDEIGRMQAVSSHFLAAAARALDSPIRVLASIVADPEPWSLPFKGHPSALLIAVSGANRVNLPEMLITALLHADRLAALPGRQQMAARALLAGYLREGRAIQVTKLMHNALPYLAGGRIAVQKDGPDRRVYAVTGNTATHITGYDVKSDGYTCDCDLFNGRGMFAGAAGECSHVMAVRLLRAAP